jgi:phosphatidylserine/phosphatidylglycerophosphate/cardiolipin synthase-like enzyme
LIQHCRKAGLAVLLTLATVFSFGSQLDASGVQVLSANQSMKPVLRLITRARKSLNIEMFLLSDKRVIAGLKDAAGRGVKIRLLLEASNRSNRVSAKKLKHKRIWLRWYQAPVAKKKAKLHARAACADSRRLLVGSADWSRQGLSRDRESLVVVDDLTVARIWEKQFQSAWKSGVSNLPRKWRLVDELNSLPDPQIYMEGDPRLNNGRKK